MKTLKFAFHLFAVAMVIASFLWMPQPPTAQAAGNAPIVLIVNDAYGANPFGRYLGEILRAEGLNAFDVIDLSALNAGELAAHKVALLAETSLSAAQALTLTTYVNGGGRLIAMRPDSQIKGLFGLDAAAGTLTDGYLKFDTAQTGASGLTTSRLQIHGNADQYTPASTAITVAQLYTVSTPLPYPAVILTATGRAAAFTYDLARNVAYTRQGNPASANKIYGSPQVADGQGITGTWDLADPPVTRTTSLFQFSNVLTAAAWVDRDLIPVPQADEQQRLLARLLRQLIEDQTPLPQLWYFPDTAKTMLILTGDAHGTNYDTYLSELTSINNYSGTISLYMSIGGALSNTAMLDFQSQGHDFGIHPYAYRLDGYAPYSSTTLATGYSAMNTWWNDQHSAITKSRTVRNHQVAWEGWTTAADIEAAYGMRLDTNFYHWGLWLQQANGAWPHGYITGSGQPMKFVRADGTLVPTYQQLTELVDEQLMIGGQSEGLTSGQALAVSQNMMNASLDGDYAALMTQFHLDYYGSTQAWAEGTMAYANAMGIPIWNAERWLNFTEIRHDANYSNLAWNAGTRTLSYSLTATNTAGLTLTTQLPLAYGGFGLSAVTMGGSPYTYTTQTVKGQLTAFISAAAGNHDFTVTYAGPLPGGSLTQTTYSDFGQACAVLTNTHDSDLSGGAVTLAANFVDTFSGPSLNTSRWATDTYPTGGIYTPTFASGQITLPPQGRIESTGIYTSGVVEAIAEFSAGTNQHLGFDDGSFTSKLLLFSTDGSSTRLFARANNNASEHFLDLGPIPSGMHRYRIEWQATNVTTDTASFYIDGAFVYSTTVAHFTNPLALFLSNVGSANLKADSIQVTPSYVTSGTYTSCVLDAGVNMGWQTASWDAVTVSGTLTVEARTSFDGLTWGNWTTVASSGGSVGASARYGQYRLNLATTDTSTSPQVNSVTLSYGPTAVQMTKADSAASAAIGEAVTHVFTITVPQTTTYSLVLTETLPAGLFYSLGSMVAPNISPVPTQTINGPNDGTGVTTVTWNFGDAVFASSPATVTFSAVVANVSGNQAGAVLTDTATLAYNNSFGAPQTPLTGTDNVTVSEPTLALNKAVTTLPSPADAGGVVQYRATITHTGGANSSPAYDVVFTDTLPAGLTLNAPITITANGAVGAASASAGNVVTITFTSLAAGNAPTVDYTATLSQSVAPGETITNTGWLAWTSRPGVNSNERSGAGGLNDYAAQSAASLTVDDLVFSKVLGGTSASHTAGSNVTIGEVATYTLNITLPEGTTPALQLVDNLPAGMVFVTATVNTTGFGGSVPAPSITNAGGSGDDATLNFGAIIVTSDNNAANDSFAVNLQARVLDVPGNVGGSTTLTNSATLQAGSGPVFNGGPVDVNVVEPVLSLSKTITPTAAAASDVITVTLIATNTGTSNAYDVVVNDPFSTTKFTNFTAVTTPAGFTFGTSTVGGNTVVSFSGGAITTTQTFVFTASLTSGVVPFETITNTATIAQATTLPGVDANERNEPTASATATLDIVVPDLSVSKTDGLTSVTPGQLITYTITITNSGQHGATGVVVSDTLPANVAYSASSDGGGNAGGVVTWPAFSLAAGTSVTRSVSVLINNPVLTGVVSITNNVNVRDDGAHGVDPTSADNSAVDTDTVVAAPDMLLTKSDGGLSAVPGAIFTYTLTYTNAGNQGATGVVITETIPANTVFNSGASTAGWNCSNAPCTFSVAGAVAGGNASGTVKFAVTVNTPAPAGVNTLSNSAGIVDDGSNGADTNPNNNFASATTTLNALPNLAVAKTDGGITTTPGSVVTYTLTYSNAGNQNATGVTLTETVPAQTSFYAAGSPGTWSCLDGSGPGTSCTTTAGALSGNGASGSVAFAVRLNSSMTAGTSQVSNTASIADDGANGADSNPANNSSTDTTPVTAAPDLKLDKTDSGPALPGSTVVYNLTYQNIGNQDATGVFITETVPAYTNFNSASSSLGWSCANGSGPGTLCGYAIGALAGGSLSSVNFAVSVTTSVPSGVTQIVNTASITDDGTNGADSNPANNTSVLSTTVTAAPDLRLTLSDANLTAVPGALITYTLSYSNTGNQGTNASVVVTAAIPAHTVFSSGTPGWNCAGTPCTFSAGALAGGASSQITLSVQVNNPIAAGIAQVTLNGGVTYDGSDGADSNPANNTASEATPVNADSDLRLTQADGLTSAVPGAAITYTLNYTNTGNQNADGVFITETFPANTTFNATASSAGWTCGGNACTLPVGTVAGSASGTARFVVTVDNPIAAGVTSLTNLAGVGDNGANGADATPSNNLASDVNTVNAAPDLSLVKSDGGLPTVPGLNLTYYLDYANLGNQAATGAVITETVPPSTTFKAALSTPGWSCPDGSGGGTVCSLNLLSPLPGGGYTGTATFVLFITDPTPWIGTVTNTATIGEDGLNGADTNPANNTSTDTTPVVASGELALSKTDGGLTVVPGGLITYTLAYTNSGNTPSVGVVITETTPAYTTFNASASTPGWACAGATCAFNVIGQVPARGGVGSVQFVVTVDSVVPAGVFTIGNTAVIGDDGLHGIDPLPDNNQAQSVTPLSAFPDLSLNLVGNAPSVPPGGAITYTLVYSNSGNRGAAGVVLTTTIPTNTTFLPTDSDPAWVCVGSNCTLNAGIVAGGGAETSVVFVVQVNVPFPAGTQIINQTAAIGDDGANGVDPVLANNTANIATSVMHYLYLPLIMR